MKPRALTIKISEDLHERLKMFAVINKTTIKRVLVVGAEVVMKRKHFPKEKAA